jgi:hypothetical protein
MGCPTGAFQCIEVTTRFAFVVTPSRFVRKPDGVGERRGTTKSNPFDAASLPPNR